MTTFREMEAFVAVIEMGSFKEAAKRLNTSQSAISRLIREFESGFDQSLFDRGQRSSQVTITGLEVFNKVKEILRQRIQLTERFSDTALLMPMLRIGITELDELTWLSEFLVELRAKHPTLRVKFESGTSSLLYAQLRAGKLDVVVVNDEIRSQDMVRIPVGGTSMAWFCHPELSVKGEVWWKRSDIPLLLPNSDSETANIVGRWLTDRNIKITENIYSDNLLSLMNFAKAGFGAACLPKILVTKFTQESELMLLGSPREQIVSKHIVLANLDDLNELLHSVITILQQCCTYSLEDKIHKTYRPEKNAS